jgi:hypothetical protein
MVIKCSLLGSNDKLDVWVGAHNIGCCNEDAIGHDHVNQFWIEQNGWGNQLKGLQYPYLG